ncbi:MAG: aminotransferase class V-fold PLP-dependent enzyme [Proteobacteria bacterium]|nr:aminotransferase class V-fold PLP-dependent enzyme [Pseudomonadota bacterium]NIS68897.1 aminotransferase class V-fold PLP-dependent enzyme [Pseudomonadota bacterium]
MIADKPLKLMIPGPVEVEEDVLAVMANPVMPHYGVAWTKLFNETIELLKSVFNTEGDVFLMVGSGTAGIDACIGSSVRRGEKILVGVNGYFGDRLAIIAEGYGLQVVRLEREWGTPIPAATVKQALHEHPDAKAVAMVHLETSTAIVNPIEVIGPLVKEAGALFIIDSVSSLGGIPLKVDAWGIDLCASATQKCLGAPPGLTPVSVSSTAWEAILANDTPHGWYLDLKVWRQYAIDWADWEPYPTTTATSNVLTLRASLKRLLEEGLEVRLNRYRDLALQLRQGLREIGMPPYTPDEDLVPVLTPVCAPEGVPAGEVVEYMEQVQRIKIAPGLGEALQDKIFRIGHMSPAVTSEDIEDVLRALASFTPSWRD